ncbi:SGNH/GDSL hydrolase family protein [Sulfuriroseicoccus oceanibius]|uniref:SGNH/GDSL hydrolase family protein n=1 Tax=Sulfuriroseicoccus oceanibius TaxID=2707525 RepID=A0A6B3LCS5_9BACT|nr:SGNH/GDSL hydrolase family protein [Sulfuriroseicoccus oceanibius]QQL45682.1 hypothetical protein G3M56_003580 [Sulfuriroseicoccus oceanibius]
MHWIATVVVGVLLMVGTVVAGPAEDVRARVKQEGAGLKVLFVGNSYSFEVPKAFARVAKREGHGLEVSQVTKGGQRLSGHAADENLKQQIAEGGWDVVVLQEQSQLPSFPAGQVDAQCVPAVRQLVATIRDAGAVPVLFQTWGRRDGDRQNRGDDDFLKMNQRLAAGYARMAASVDPALYVVPVGDAWAAVMAGGNGGALYQRDGSHPSMAGVELAAATIYAALYYDKPEAGSLSQTEGVDRQRLIDAVSQAMRQQGQAAKQ